MQAYQVPHLPGLPALRGIRCDITPAVEEDCMTSVAPHMASRPCHRQHHGCSYLQPVSNWHQLLCLVLPYLGEWPLLNSLIPPFVHETHQAFGSNHKAPARQVHLQVKHSSP